VDSEGGGEGGDQRAAQGAAQTCSVVHAPAQQSQSVAHCAPAPALPNDWHSATTPPVLLDVLLEEPVDVVGPLRVGPQARSARAARSREVRSMDILSR
jgi:CelD/BcsL family acetyltransferase involved in cellulose biosynthesis